MTSFSRRALIAAAAASSLSSTLVWPRFGSAAAEPIDLEVETRVLDIAGRAYDADRIVQSSGADGLSFDLSDSFDIRLHNKLDEPTLLHWHGLTPPWRQDGVPDLSQKALPPGQTYDYAFPLTSAGTHWMHSHQGLQEQALLAAPLIVRDPAEADLDEQEVVIMLQDVTFKPAEQWLEDLRGGHGAMMQGTDMDSMDMPPDSDTAMMSMSEGQDMMMEMDVQHDGSDSTSFP